MATSGTESFNPTGATIIDLAMQAVGVYAVGETVPAAEVTQATNWLNLNIKQWQAVPGVHLWKRQDITLYLKKNTVTYKLGATGGATGRASESSINTTLSATEAIGETVIAVTDSTGMSATDNVGVLQDDNTLHWTTIASVDSSVQITLDVATTVAAASGNKVYTYPTANQTPRPLDVIQARRLDKTDNETDVLVVSKDEYDKLGVKTSTGTVNQCFYEPTLVDGTLKVWTAADDESLRLILSCKMPIEDVGTVATDTLDFPQEWIRALILQLASDLGLTYGVDAQKQSILDQKAGAAMQLVYNNDSENEPIYFTVEM